MQEETEKCVYILLFLERFCDSSQEFDNKWHSLEPTQKLDKTENSLGVP